MLTEPEFYLMMNSIHVEVIDRSDGHCNVIITGQALVDGKCKEFILFRRPAIRNKEYYATQGNLKKLWFAEMSDFAQIPYEEGGK